MYRELLEDAGRRLFDLLRFDEYNFNYQLNKIYYSEILDSCYVMATYDETFAISFDENGYLNFYKIDDSLDKNNFFQLFEKEKNLLASFLFSNEKMVFLVEDIIRFLVNETIKYHEINITKARCVINKILVKNNFYNNLLNFPIKNYELKKYEKTILDRLKKKYTNLFLACGFEERKICTELNEKLGFVTYTKSYPFSLCINNEDELTIFYSECEFNPELDFKKIVTLTYFKKYQNLIIDLIQKINNDYDYSFTNKNSKQEIEKALTYLITFLNDYNISTYRFVEKKLYTDFANKHKISITKKKLEEYSNFLKQFTNNVIEEKNYIFLFTLPSVSAFLKDLELTIDSEGTLYIKIFNDRKNVIYAKTEMNEFCLLKIKNLIYYLNNLNSQFDKETIKINLYKIFNNNLIFLDKLY